MAIEKTTSAEEARSNLSREQTVLRDIDNTVQDLSEKVGALCRAGQARLLEMGPYALADCMELFKLISDTVGSAEDFVNYEAEKLGANYIDEARRSRMGRLLAQKGVSHG